MSEIADFFTHQYQFKLRRLCQVESERYEDVLQNYKLAFLTELKLIENQISTDGTIISQMTEYEKIVYQFLKEIDITTIQDAFIELENIYVKWIDFKSKEAISLLEKFIESKQILNEEIDIQKYILFRARKSQDILTKLDMFHIPFNKRYLISNQRYSLTGQPLFYLGLSVYDIINELGGDSCDEYKVSTIEFKNSFDVIDFRNKIDFFLKRKMTDSLIPEYSEEITLDKFKKWFFEFILIECCSFERKKEHSTYYFYEEYVLPQMVAQYLKETGKNGLVYSSTKKCLEQDTLRKVVNFSYKDNIAIFTHFDREHIYDDKLFHEVKISTPIAYSKIDESLTIEKLIAICDSLKDMDTGGDFEKYYNVGLEQKNAFAGLQIKKDEYFTSQIGKFQLYLVYYLLYEKRNQV
jgi:hypothetical protein